MSEPSVFLPLSLEHFECSDVLLAGAGGPSTSRMRHRINGGLDRGYVPYLQQALRSDDTELLAEVATENAIEGDSPLAVKPSMHHPVRSLRDSLR